MKGTQIISFVSTNRIKNDQHTYIILSAEEKQALEALRQSHTDFGECGFDGNNDFSANVLDGSKPIDISYVGGELQELTCKIVGDFWKM
jgi:hypothetical protein